MQGKTYSINKELQKQQYPLNDETLTKIREILIKNSEAKRIVLQYPLKLIGASLAITSIIKEQFKNIEIYTLFDSMKNPCCTDEIGAQHVDYEILIHFGQACFSQPHKSKHYYLFPTINTENQQKLKKCITSEQFIKNLMQKNIGFILAQQKLYQYVKEILSTKNDLFNSSNIKMLKLPYDALQNDTYLIFGYYLPHEKSQGKRNNILTLFERQPQQDDKLLSNLHLSLSYLHSAHKEIFTQIPQLFKFSIQSPKIILSNINYSKKLMTRLSLIGQLEKYDTFGILASNVGTQFCQRSIKRCTQILNANKKKHFLFMMNNLNEVKLGNFPEIQVYVIISCFNNSCFSTKDFCRLVVTPMDLQVAFNNNSVAEYNFDLRNPNQTKIQNQDSKIQELTEKNQAISTEISLKQKQEIMLANTLQTLDFYRNKLYKGLDFSQQKPVESIKKGKIGLAEQYEPLQKKQYKK